MHKRLNIFIDESGSVLPLDGNITNDLPFSDSFYSVSLLFTFDDDDSIYETIRQVNELKDTYGITEAIHFGPLIRRESGIYKQFTIEEIRKIYFRTARIISKSQIFFSTITLNKKSVNNIQEFETYLINNFSNIYFSNPFINDVNEIKVYYDNGQECVRNFIKYGIFKYFINHNENIFYARQKDYVLLQLADYICTMNLIDLKRRYNVSSNTEKAVFNDTKKYKKNIKDLLLSHKFN